MIKKKLIKMMKRFLKQLKDQVVKNQVFKWTD